jgi:hypothetical protein
LPKETVSYVALIDEKNNQTKRAQAPSNPKMVIMRSILLPRLKAIVLVSISEILPTKKGWLSNMQDVK